MRIYLLVLLISAFGWADSLNISKPECPIDSSYSDSTLAESDSLIVGRISHHLNSRNSTDGHPFDWFANLKISHKYNMGWNPEFNAEASTEREDGNIYDAYLMHHATEYYFIRDRVDEEHDLYLFEYGIHYTWLDIKHGYSYIWRSNIREEQHTLYHSYESEWLKAEIQYLDKIYKIEIEVSVDKRWPIKSDEIFIEIGAKYLHIHQRPEIWSLGYSLGYEW